MRPTLVPQLVALALLLAGGCTPTPWATGAEQTFEEPGWPFADSLSFALVVDDTARPYALRLSLTLTEDFGTQNLWVKTRVETPAGPQPPSRLELLVVDPTGHWHVPPHWLTGHHRFVRQLADTLRFPQPGTYRFHLRHDMRADTVAGVQAVGLGLQPL